MSRRRRRKFQEQGKWNTKIGIQVADDGDSENLDQNDIEVHRDGEDLIARHRQSNRDIDLGFPDNIDDDDVHGDDDIYSDTDVQVTRGAGDGLPRHMQGAEGAVLDEPLLLNDHDNNSLPGGFPDGDDTLSGLELAFTDDTAFGQLGHIGEGHGLAALASSYTETCAK